MVKVIIKFYSSKIHSAMKFNFELQCTFYNDRISIWQNLSIHLLISSKNIIGTSENTTFKIPYKIPESKFSKFIPKYYDKRL